MFFKKKFDPSPRGVPLDYLQRVLSTTTLKISRDAESLIAEHETAVTNLKVIPPMKELQPTAGARAQLLQRIKELGLDFFDHERALWIFCPAGKVFDFGDAGYHYLLNEYGKNFIVKPSRRVFEKYISC